MNRIRSKVSTDVLSKGFKPAKCKTSLKLTAARIKLLKNKREVQVRQMRRELAQLLDSGQEQTARIRVEHVIREERTMSAYELIDLYCELIVARLPIIEAQKSCPIDLKEAISSVVFASPRCADLPDLMDVRKLFAAKYGKEFITSALEVRPDCGVSSMLVEKLSAKAPDVETKIKTLTAIAQEHNVKWDSKAFEEQLHKPNADLLNGPNTFGNQKNDSTMKSFQNEVTSKPTSTNNSRNTPVASTSQYESRAPDHRSAGEFNTSSSREDNASLDRPVWNMEFKDATSAAQAAAESAERASMAARAAAELASRENVSRQSSTASHDSLTYGIRHNNPIKSLFSKPEGANIAPVTKENEVRISQGINLDEQNLQREEVSPSMAARAAAELENCGNVYVSRQASSEFHDSPMYGIKQNKPVNSFSSEQEGADITQASVAKKDELRSQGTHPDEQNLQRKEVSPSRENESIDGDHASFRRRPLSVSSSHSSGTFLNDNLSEVNFHNADMKAYHHAQESSSEEEPEGQDLRTEIDENVGSGRWNKDESYHNSASSHFTRSAFDADILWDSTIRGHDNNSIQDSRKDKGEDIFGSEQPPPAVSINSAAVFDNYGSDTDDSVFGRNKDGNLFDSFLPDQREPSSFSSNSDTFSPKQHGAGSVVRDSGSKLHFLTEPHSVEHSEPMKNEFLPLQSDRLLPVTFDDSDTETKSEMAFSSVSSGGYKKSHEKAQISADKIGRKSSSDDLPNNQPSWKNEEPQPWRSSKVSETAESEEKGKNAMPFSHSGARDNEISNELSSENDQSLNLGRLTGGLKNKGFQIPPYVKSPLVETSVLSQQTPYKPSSVPNESYADLEFPGDKYDTKSYQEDYMSNSRISRAHMEAGFDEDKNLVSRRASARRGYKGQASPSEKITEDTTDINQIPVASGQGYSNSSISSSNKDSIEQRRHDVGRRHSRDTVPVQPEQSTDVPPAVEAPKVELYDRRPHRMAHNELSSKMAVTYFESDDDEPVELDKRQTAGHKNVKLSWRTRGLRSEAENSYSRSTDRSDVPVNPEKENKSSTPSSAFVSSSNTTTPSMNLEGKDRPRSVQAKSSTDQPSMQPTKSEPSADRHSTMPSKQDSTESVVPGNNGNPTASISSKESISRESSLKSAAHVHPKLPDYESLAAHFHSLRANKH